MNHPDQTTADTEFDIAALVADIRRRKFVILGVALLFAAIGAVLGLTLPKKYEASVTISPVLDEGGSGRLGALGSLAAQAGGLASLAGLALPGKGRKDESLAVLQSELLTEAYIRDNNLLPVLYADEWDAASGRWTGKQPPTLWKANNFFKKRVRDVTEDRKSGLVVLTIRWRDPQLAAKWANDLVRLANNYLRKKAIDESERNIAYLNEQAAKTNVVEVQKAVYTLLEDEINREMVARGRDEYALRVVDPAFVPEQAVSWGPKRNAAVGFLIGGILSILVIAGRRLLSA